jgi:hypothetical protein
VRCSARPRDQPDDPFGRAELLGAAIGLAFGAVGIGCNGRPPDASILAAIRARSPSHARATIVLRDVTRNCVHEIFGTSASRFPVTATVTPPGEPEVERGFGVEPVGAGTAIAFGPYAPWRCD